jgi:sugar phosphate permease
MSVEYGGKKINATLSGIFDGLSMLGASFSGYFIFIFLTNRFLGTFFFDEKDPNVGWDYIYLILFITSIIISFFTLLFCLIDCLKMRKRTK